MQYDRKILITVGNNRKSINWQTQTIMLSGFYEKLRIPNRSTESMQEYLSLKKSEQDDRKDIGGFVAGSLSGTRRKAGAVTGRDVITLDLDNIPPGGADEILKRVDGLGCGYCIYSTRKHSPASPRLRVLLPVDRTATADEYEPVARYIAANIGIEFADPTTFETTRLMYWPSCCADSEYIYVFGDKPMLSVDGILDMINEKFGDWRDVSNWPQVPGSENAYKKMAVKQSDPLSKNGVIGAFCRTYDIYGVMDTFLDGIYEAVDSTPGRYTYLGGSTTGGAVVYDNGLFLYSHHSTDPCCGRLVNAFDLVRLHKFGELDDEAKPNTPENRLPSYTKMINFAMQNPSVSKLMAREDFASIPSDEPTSNLNWTESLTRNQNGGYHKTLNNISLLIQNVPELNGCARRDDFSGRIYTAEGLPWRSEKGYWSDADTTELRKHFETRYKGFKPGKQDVKDAVVATAVKQKFHPVRNYLVPLVWDGVPRLDTLFIDYLGVTDSEYSRAVTRKAMVGAVARVMTPGCKFDYMLVFVGKQGRGKSSIIYKLAGGDEWFTDSLVIVI